jgi:hypothetical protein
MAMINVKLRIVGLYFNATVRVEDNPNLTVRDVMDEYIRMNPNLAVPGGLEYGRFPIGTTDFVTRLTYHYPGKYDFDGNNVLVPQPVGVDGPTLGKKDRPAGIYTLGENLEDQLLDKKAGLVWQYYVVSPGGVVKSKTPASRGFQGFGVTPPSYNFENNDTIIWRLVAIAREPNFL